MKSIQYRLVEERNTLWDSLMTTMNIYRRTTISTETTEVLWVGLQTNMSGMFTKVIDRRHGQHKL